MRNSSNSFMSSSQSLVSTDQSTSSTGSDPSLAVSADKSINDYRTMNPNKYIFIFIKNSRKTDNVKNSSGIGYMVDVDYLMDEAFSSIDKLAPYLRNGDYNIDVVKKWVNSANLDNFLLEIKNASQEDESKFDDRNPNLDIYLGGSLSPEIISSRVEPFNIFVIGSFNEQMIEFLSPKPGITISPLTVAYWKQYGESLALHLKTSDSQPLCSECLKNTFVYFSEIIPLDGRYLLYKLLKFMGGAVADKLELKVTHAVSETDSGSVTSSQDKRIIAAYFFEIPIVNTNWIHTAWLQLQLQYKFASNHNFVRTYLCGQPSVDAQPILRSFTIGVLASVYSDEEKANYFTKLSSINNVVVRFGGRFVMATDCLEFQNINLIIHLNDDSLKQKRKCLDAINEISHNILNSYENDADYRRLIERQCDETLPIVTIDWLVETIIEFKVQPFEPYLIKVRDSMPNEKSSEEILQEIKKKDFDKTDTDYALATSWIESSSSSSSSQLDRIQKRKK